MDLSAALLPLRYRDTQGVHKISTSFLPLKGSPVSLLPDYPLHNGTPVSLLPDYPVHKGTPFSLLPDYPLLKLSSV